VNAVAEVMRIYQGSDGGATRGLYARLEKLGPIGQIAVNLFRAQKASERAKKYRGGDGRSSYRQLAYDRKQWAINNLSTALAEHAETIGFAWGWGEDEKQEYHRQVLYVDLPTGQVSFHTAGRGEGPDYPGQWDGVRGQSADRVVRWIGRLLDGQTASDLANSAIIIGIDYGVETVDGDGEARA
jgi:hypothetical protein